MIRLRKRLRPGWRLGSWELSRNGAAWILKLEGGPVDPEPGGRNPMPASLGIASFELPRRCRPGNPLARRRLQIALACAVGDLAVASGAGLRVGQWGRKQP